MNTSPLHPLASLTSPHLAPFAIITADGMPMASAWSWRTAARTCDALQLDTHEPHYVVRVYEGSGR